MPSVSFRLTAAVLALALLACPAPEDEEVEGITIDINENPGGTDCNINVKRWVVFSPNPSSVPAGQYFRWKNNTSQTITIVSMDTDSFGNGVEGTPWETVAPGETGPFLGFDEPGIFRYAAQGCHSYFDGAGTLNVTAAFR